MSDRVVAVVEFGAERRCGFLVRLFRLGFSVPCVIPRFDDLRQLATDVRMHRAQQLRAQLSRGAKTNRGRAFAVEMLDCDRQDALGHFFVEFVLVRQIGKRDVSAFQLGCERVLCRR